jgi:hypothetical protein
MLILGWALPLDIHILERSSKFKWIWREVQKNFKNL